MRQFFFDYVTKHSDLSIQELLNLQEVHGMRKTCQIIGFDFVSYLDVLSANIDPYPHVKPYQPLRPLLENLKSWFNLRYFVVTHNSEKLAHKIINAISLDGKLFEAIVTPETLEICFDKYHKEFWEAFCEEYGIDPNQCLAVGDRLKTDIEAPAKAGITAGFLVHNGPRDISSKLIPTLQQLAHQKKP